MISFLNLLERTLVSSKKKSFKIKKILMIKCIFVSEPGVLEFSKPSIVITESARKARIPVKRSNGADGHVSIKWKTKDMTAHHGIDYEGGEGELKFDNGETMKNIEIFIHDTKVCLQVSND